MPTALELLLHRLDELRRSPYRVRYQVPSLWIPPHLHAGIRRLDNPADYYYRIVSSILARPYQQQCAFGKNELIYLAFIRLTTAWDHDGSGVISYRPGNDGWRQTGTLLKTIALLPYLKSLGVTTLLLLPPTSHGRLRIKGNLGSPYAPRDHRAIEETLSEPILQLGAETEFSALVEACHRMGIRLLVELALRVASLDCPLIAEHPDSFYWVRADAPDPLMPPHFTDDQLRAIERCIKSGDFAALPEPPAEYRDLFVEPPQNVWCLPDGSFVGITADGLTCRVPSAFADYPPNDRQPVWSDITYFQLHRNARYNYIAYNTVRYYMPQLDGHENRSLWEYLTSIVPDYIERFAIDGILLDMGHAFPRPLHALIVERSRQTDPRTIFIEESFDRADRIASAFGYDAVVGDVWHYARSIESLRRFATELERLPSLRYLATPDTHNTPRIASSGIEAALYAYSICSQLPNGIPTVTTGSELGEIMPINTGLDFTENELAIYSAQRLPLFSGHVLRWDTPDIRLLRFLVGLYGTRSR